jgi:hypothetical protein
MGTSQEPRDLLAERIRRLEARIGELGSELHATRSQLERATTHLDALVDLVGRLGRIVDVQGDALSGDEGLLERKVDSLGRRVDGLADRLGDAVSRLEVVVGSIVPRR